MTWSERRRAALTAAASEVLAELTERYGAKSIERALAGRAPAAMMPADVELLLDAERELAGAPDRLEDVRLSDLLDTAAAILVGPGKPGERAPLDRYFDHATAAEIDRFGPYTPGPDVEVEPVEDTLPIEPGSVVTPSEAAPARASEPEPAPPTPAPAAAKAPPTVTPLRPVVDWDRAWRDAQAAQKLGPSAVRHQHSFDAEGRCSVCRHTCVHPVEAWRDGACSACGARPAECPHFYLRGKCVRCGRK